MVRTHHKLLMFDRNKISSIRQQLKSCVNLPYSTLDTNFRLLHKHKPVYVVCQTEGEVSKHACSLLSTQGFHCKSIEGGLNEINNRLPENTHKPNNPLVPLLVERREGGHVWSLERQARFMSGVLTLCSLFGYAISKKRVFLYRTASFPAAAALSSAVDNCGMAKVLRKMPWNKDNYRWL